MSGDACGVELRVIGNVAMNAKRYGARARVYAAPRHPRAETHLGTARNVAASARAYERRTRKRVRRTRESICARNDTRDLGFRV